MESELTAEQRVKAVYEPPVVMSAQEAGAMRERVRVLEEALRRIRDEASDCGCECDDENCCNKAGFACSNCIARAALKG